MRVHVRRMHALALRMAGLCHLQYMLLSSRCRLEHKSDVSILNLFLNTRLFFTHTRTALQVVSAAAKGDRSLAPHTPMATATLAGCGRRSVSRAAAALVVWVVLLGSAFVSAVRRDGELNGYENHWLRTHWFDTIWGMWS